MLGTTGLSGLPSALFTFGSAGAAIAVGMLSERGGQGRRLAAPTVSRGDSARTRLRPEVTAAFRPTVASRHERAPQLNSGSLPCGHAGSEHTLMAPLRRRPELAEVRLCARQLPERLPCVATRWIPHGFDGDTATRPRRRHHPASGVGRSVSGIDASATKSGKQPGNERRDQAAREGGFRAGVVGAAPGRPVPAARRAVADGAAARSPRPARRCSSPSCRSGTSPVRSASANSGVEKTRLAGWPHVGHVSSRGAVPIGRAVSTGPCWLHLYW